MSYEYQKYIANVDTIQDILNTFGVAIIPTM